MTAIQRLMALAGAAEVDAAKRKFLADVQRAVTMTQPAVDKGDAHAKTYHAALMSVKLRAADSTTVAQIESLRKEFLTLQKLRREWLGGLNKPGSGNHPSFLDGVKASAAKAGDRVKLLDPFYDGVQGVLVKLGKPGYPSEIRIPNGKVIKTSLWYNLEE